MPRAYAYFSPQNRALVTSGNSAAANAAGFRLRPGGGPFRSGSNSRCAPLRLRSTFPARRPQTEAKQERFDHAFVLSKLTQRIE